MNSVRAIQQLNKRELEAGIGPEGSWHTDYRDTAFINVGGLPFELSEGDVITIFSQFGEPVWIKLARDKETGKSRGFAWIKYEDQRSCDLAVDNLGGATIMDRVLRVDHARYKPKDDEDMRDNTMGELDLDPGNESEEGRRKRRKTASESESDEDRPLLPEEIELERLMDKLDEDDPMRDSMIKRQHEKVDDALRKLKKAKRREKEGARTRSVSKTRRRTADATDTRGTETRGRAATVIPTMNAATGSQDTATVQGMKVGIGSIIALASDGMVTQTNASEIDDAQQVTVMERKGRDLGALHYRIALAPLAISATKISRVRSGSSAHLFDTVQAFLKLLDTQFTCNLSDQKVPPLAEVFQ
ncbi:hypothetical protein EK21DRAFT_113237 [Setomelanomma holmii]|uniref:RRM domain-containing protein n=1 Tax=Setomelanomma holmii TaxID=210430 RepID=A0A9P4H8V7_9PLEO|nr:hypothetical protein EK21DRAFT_113237 [Setomelanomma holmii]